ncbi:Cof-type HAD-IIB family hydrolase [Paenibacillus flagellatus]|uniref:Cof-type HAD-IIB family hydrolase n=1 Tax=Paenibacillus flagellatus TaxID=2211139 RepID=A0A2V5KAJ9_9BACL|nr:Cof-type HAD-IIB family hydrolase [Paenibacillus flagellatus]PYI56478.1 Cof-type HAD-IIB family hydrolase [Paenibacillus flagellatus]
MNYRLIALDVDGTLINDRYELTERTKRTVRDVHRAGATIVLCTGRSPVNTLPLMEELGLEGTLITHNGAATIRSSDREIVHEFPFTVAELGELVRYCRERRIHMDVCSPFRLFVEGEPGETEAAMYRKFMLEPTVVDDVLSLPEPPVKFTIFGEPETMDRVETDWAAMKGALNVIRSGDRFIDVMHAEATKGNALKRLAESLGIDRSQVMAIGNYFNDVEMIRFAGLGIAMDNSPDGVKREADAVTASNNDDGVHEALVRYVLNGSPTNPGS